MLTKLRPTGSLFAGKEILCDNSIKSAPHKELHHQRIEFDHITELYEYVLTTQYKNAIIVRGLTENTKRLTQKASKEDFYDMVQPPPDIRHRQAALSGRGVDVEPARSHPALCD